MNPMPIAREEADLDEQAKQARQEQRGASRGTDAAIPIVHPRSKEA